MPILLPRTSKLLDLDFGVRSAGAKGAVEQAEVSDGCDCKWWSLHCPTLPIWMACAGGVDRDDAGNIKEAT